MLPRLIPQFETYPRLVRFFETPTGKIAALALFGLLLSLRAGIGNVLALNIILFAMTFFPEYRRTLLTFGTMAWIAGPKSWVDWRIVAEYASNTAARTASLILFFGFGALCWWLVLRFKSAAFARRPIVSLHLLYSALLVCACTVAQGPVRLYLWWFLALLSFYFWSLCYSLTDRNAKNRDGFFRQLGTWHPFWGGTSTPYPKGASYLRKTEAHSAEELAITQIKGLKLLAWATVLSIVLDVMLYALHGAHGDWVKRAARLTGGYLPPHLALPTLSQTFQRSLTSMPYPWYTCWVSVIIDFLKEMLDIAIVGHSIIASCRMAGFRAARNTWRPLRSRNIADFWNRYYFYFKELLVEFFFFPTYLRYFKRHPRLRMFAATFAAAGLGNMIFHFMRDIHFVAELGFWAALRGFQSYAFYAVLLATGIGISQLRAENKTAKPSWLRARIGAPATVILFYCVLHVFDDTGRAHPLSERFVFLAQMVGLHV